MYGPASGMTYDALREFIAQGRSRLQTREGTYPNRPVGNNTRVIAYDDGRIALRFHSTDVATMAPDGTMTLDSGGRRTLTTKDRINGALRIGPGYHARGHVWTDRGIWYYGRRAPWMDGATVPVPFFDGMRIGPDGAVVNPEDGPSMADAEALRSRIRAYARGYVNEMTAGAMPAPSAGDCLICQLAARGTVNGDRDRIPDTGADHLASHLDESYYVPSLLMAVLRARGIVPGQFAGSAWLPRIVEVNDGERRMMPGGIADSPSYRRWIAAYLRTHLGA